MNLLLRNNQQLSTLTIRFATSITSNSTRKQNLKRQKLICHHDGSCVSRIYIYIYLYLSTRVNPLAPNGIYIYMYYRTANLQTLHFKYLLNKYTY